MPACAHSLARFTQPCGDLFAAALPPSQLQIVTSRSAMLHARSERQLRTPLPRLCLSSPAGATAVLAAEQAEGAAAVVHALYEYRCLHALPQRLLLSCNNQGQRRRTHGVQLQVAGRREVCGEMAGREQGAPGSRNAYSAAASASCASCSLLHGNSSPERRLTQDPLLYAVAPAAGGSSGAQSCGAPTPRPHPHT